MAADRTKGILQHMIGYCVQIRDAVERFGDDYGVFQQDADYKNATALCVLQIGELTTHLPDDFKKRHDGIPWVQVKAMRNVVAHSYGTIDTETLWETITNDIPALENYCRKLLAELDI